MNLCVIKKKLTVGPKKGQSMYGLGKISSPTIHNNVIVDDVKEASTFSEADAKMIIKEFGHTVSRFLSQGYIVDMGVLGTIRPTLSAKSVDSEKECTAATIRSRRILYRSRKDFADDVKGMSLSITNLSGSRNTGTEIGNPEGGDSNVDTGDNGSSSGNNNNDGGGGGFEG